MHPAFGRRRVCAVSVLSAVRVQGACAQCACGPSNVGTYPHLRDVPCSPGMPLTSARMKRGP
jgi:hypothetical protein